MVGIERLLMREDTDIPERYLAAERECERFLKVVDELRARFAKDETFAKYIDITGGPETAAVRRASMDLTRQLAKLRRGEA
jgi:hypothetical protein